MVHRGLPNIPSERKKGTFVARFDGRCGVCDDEIEPGDECHYVDDEVCHADCE